MRPRDKCECCSDGLGWIWNPDNQAVENCPACNPLASAHLIEPRLRAIEGRGRAAGNEWLTNLGWQKQREDAGRRVEPGLQQTRRVH